MLASVLLTVAAHLATEPQTGGYELPEGFGVERAADVAASFIALAFDPEGRALISREDGGLIWLEDRDGDAFFEASGDYTDRIQACQGMAWKDGLLYAVGAVDGVVGLHRMTPTQNGRGVRSVELVAAVEGNGGEHGPHGVAVGADGMLYMMLGDHVRMASAPRGDFPLLSAELASKLWSDAPIRDPNGHGHDVTYPCGYVARIDPATGEWDYHSVGYRNAYDLAFDGDGELFTYDSDMEWDVGLPWYRPTRFVQALPGGDYGWRPGTGVWPDYYLDVLPPALEAGRGSPTGVAFCESLSFPMRYRGALFAGDWTEGEILAFFPLADGAGHTGELETVVRTDAGLPVTDLAFGPSGDLYFVSGGRGTVGRFERLWYGGEVEPRSLRPQRQPLWLGRAVTPEMLASEDPVVARRSLESLIFERSFPQDLTGLVLLRLGDADRRIRFAAYQVVRKHGLKPVDALSFRAEVAWSAASLEGHPTWDRAVDRSADALLDFLRVQQLRLHAKGAVFAQSGAGGVAELFPHPDWRISRELALILGSERPEGAIEAVLAALEQEEDPAQQIHYAYCLTLPDIGSPGEGVFIEAFTESQARRLFRWFDVAETWSGGNSFGGYLAVMRARLAERFDGEAKLNLALGAPKKERLGLRTVAQFAGELEVGEVERLVPAIQYGWSQATDDDRRAALRALAGGTAPKLLEFLRRQCDNPDAPNEEVLAALARSGAPEDWPRFVEGLGSRSRETAEACAQALRDLERRPEGSDPFRVTLDLAQRHGPQQGLVFLQLFAHWTGEEVSVGTPDDWEGTLAGFERWGSLNFPEFRREDVDDTRRPRWSFEATLSFLAASDGRAGSAQRGAVIFRQATCASCHVVGERAWPELTGFGPDLYGVSSRFPLGGLLEATWFPSKAIAEPYRTHLATTTMGLRIEGRVVDEDVDVVVLKKADGTPVTLERSLIESLEESQLSTMPEGLLAPLTLEEVKDLFAFLAVGGGRGPEPEWAPLFDEGGRNLWEGDEKLWKIRGGVLVGRSGVKGLEESAYLVSKARFDDFELEFDVKFTDGVGNGGLQYRSSVRADRPDPLGYQVDLGEVYWGALFANDGRNELAGPEDALWREVVDRDGWNHVHLLAEGDRHVIELNGHRTVDTRDAAFTFGVLAFQLHAGPASEIRYANARIRPLR